MKKKKIVLLLIFFLGLLTIIGTTLSFYLWSSNNQVDFVLTIGEIGGNLIYTSSADLNSTNIGPSLDYLNEEAVSFNIKKTISNTAMATISIIPTVLPTSLKEESFKCALVRSTDNNIWQEVTTLNFFNKEVNTKYLISDVDLNEGNNYFKVIVYIDGNMENPKTMMGSSFSATIDVIVNDINE